MTDNDKMCDYMAIIYQHPALIVHSENNYKSVRIEEDIAFGDLLLVEHAYASPTHICQAIIQHNEYLFNMYHPRITNFEESVNRSDDAKEKLSNNCFGMENGDKLITFMVTKLNHSCDPNCAVYIQEKYKMDNTNIVFMELFAIRFLKKGTEITINYGPATAHNRDFECKCGKNFEERQKMFKVCTNLVFGFSEKNNINIRKMICQYLDESLSKKISLNHYLATKGIFINNNTVSAYTSDGEKTINDIVHKYLGLEGEIKLLDGQVIEQTMNENKINIFLKIINDNLLNS